MTPTEQQISEALAAAAQYHPEADKWEFPLPGGWHTTEVARIITRFCLQLGTPVTDVLKAETFAALVDRVEALEQVVFPR
jgi:hypothetical protein